MKSSFTKLLSTLCLLIIIPGNVWARDYVIEVIIFTHANGKFQISPHLPPQTRTPVPDDGVNLFVQKRIETDSPAADQRPAVWQLIEPDKYFMHGVAKRLRGSSNYTVLHHFSWQQPAVEKSDSLALKIEAGRDYTQSFPRHEVQIQEFGDTIQTPSVNDQQVRELEGTLKVAVSRYLHVYTDLVYRLPRKVSAQDEQRSTSGDTVLVDYPIRSHRRMRSKELHYIDHPLVGILVEARPIENTTPE